ncbi:acyltransferase, partial [Klebsiella pneumoniae]|nr:acyltransferase [Klebsiella pneumoniae]
GISLTKISNSRLDIDVDYFMTLHYTAMFIVGSLLAINLNRILQNKYVKKSGIYLFLGGILFYTYRWWFFPKKTIFHKEIIGDWMIVLRVVLIICCLLRDPFSSFMKHSVFQFLGKISYSLYLYHSIVMLTLIHLLYEYLNIYMILIISIIGSLLVAFLAHYFVERNSIKLG